MNLRKAMYLLDMARSRPEWYREETVRKRERDVKLAAYDLIKDDLVNDEGIFLTEQHGADAPRYFGEARKEAM